MATKTKKAAEVTISDKAMKFVDFARFCVNQGIEAYDVAKLVTLAERAFSAGVTYANTGTDLASKRNEASGERFEEFARSFGFKVTWPGLWPRLEKADDQGVMRDIYLPTFKD